MRGKSVGTVDMVESQVDSWQEQGADELDPQTCPECDFGTLALLDWVEAQETDPTTGSFAFYSRGELYQCEACGHQFTVLNAAMFRLENQEGKSGGEWKPVLPPAS